MDRVVQEFETAAKLVAERLGGRLGVGIGGFHRQHDRHLGGGVFLAGQRFERLGEHMQRFFVGWDEHHVLHILAAQAIRPRPALVFGQPVGALEAFDAAQADRRPPAPRK